MYFVTIHVVLLSTEFIVGRFQLRELLFLVYMIEPAFNFFLTIFFRFIGETTDISSYGSYLSVVHGSTGSLIVNRTRSITDVFLQLRNFTGHSEFLNRFAA